MNYTNSYQFNWKSLLVAGFPPDPACGVRRPCLKSTAAEFCIKYGDCPPGASYSWEQQLCPSPSPSPNSVSASSSPTLKTTATAATPSTFESFTVIELIHAAGASRERKGLEIRRMHATLAPQVTENPIYMHCTNSSLPGLTNCIGQ